MTAAVLSGAVAERLRPKCLLNFVTCRGFAENLKPELSQKGIDLLHACHPVHVLIWQDYSGEFLHGIHEEVFMSAATAQLYR